jgi:ABC transport system ATP-binding/permease protein
VWRTILADVTWRIAPGERTGVLGVNGAGKSTLLGMVAGTVTPTAGRVKRGKTVKIAVLSQELAELAEFADERVSAVIARKRTSYVAGGKEITPAQLLERLGFTSAQLATHVKDLSGGQKRRLQLLMILLDEPNVLILDEPTNDLDTDMLVAMEDLLDTWPGTLLVVSHDRYLLERITDNQFAVLDGHFRHLTRGVDQYLELRAASKKAGGGSSGGSGGGATAPKAARVPDRCRAPKCRKRSRRHRSQDCQVARRDCPRSRGAGPTRSERFLGSRRAHRADRLTGGRSGNSRVALVGVVGAN